MKTLTGILLSVAILNMPFLTMAEPPDSAEYDTRELLEMPLGDLLDLDVKFEDENKKSQEEFYSYADLYDMPLESVMRLHKLPSKNFERLESGNKKADREISSDEVELASLSF